MQRLLPPFLFLGLLAALAVSIGLFGTALAPMHSTGLPYGEVALLLAIGLVLLVGARLQFKRHDSEIMTFKEPRGLVRDGLFRFSRNPMYLGFTLLLFAAVLAANAWWALLAPVGFMLAANFWYIPFEERAAAAAFGADYEEYRRCVRRWL